MKQNMRSLVQNSGILVIANSSIKVITFLLMPLYTRVLDAADYGVTDTIINLAQLVLGAFSLCIDWGMTAFFYDEDKESYRVKLTTSGTVFCILSTLACLSMMVFSKPISLLLFHSPDYTWAVALGFVYAGLKLSYFAFRVSTRMRGQMKQVALFSMAELLSLLIMNILLILVFRVGYMAVLYANVISQVVCGGLYLLGNRKWVKPKSYDGPLLKRVLRYSIPLTPTVLLTWFNSFADRYVIGQFHDQTAVGLYGRAFQIVTMLSVLTSSFLAAYPSFAFSNASDEKKRPQYAMVYDGMVAVLGILAAFATLFAKDIFVIMTDPSYHSAYMAVGLLCFGHVFYTLGSVMGYGITVQKNGKLYLLVNASGAVCNLILNLLLVPKLGFMGSAITSCSAQLIVMLVSRHFGEKLFRCNYRVVRSLILLFAIGGICYAGGELAIWWKIPILLGVMGLILLVYRKQIPVVLAMLRRKAPKEAPKE